MINIKQAALTILLLGLLLRPSLAEVVRIIDDFEAGKWINLLQGNAGAWQKNPNNSGEYCRASFTNENIDNKPTTALHLLYSASFYDFNGYTTQLNGFDIRPYEGITLWARGAREFEPIPFKVELRSNFRTISYYYFGLTGRWQKLKIPFSKFTNFGKISEWDRVNEMVFVFEGRTTKPTGGSLYLDDVGFYSSDENYEKQTALIEKENAVKQRELDRAANLPDDLLLDYIERQTFEYFWQQASPATYLINDRATLTSSASTGATGFGLTALCIGVERKWISKSEGERRAIKTLESIRDKVAGKNGFYYHFVRPHDGKRDGLSELSSVDTALMLGGVLTVREYFSNNIIRKLADDIYLNVNWPWMMGADTSTATLLMGWDPESGFEKYIRWDMFAEGTMMYLLGMGSPAYPLPEKSWDSFARPVKDYYGHDYIYHDGESMFVYAYSHAWVDFRGKHDKYADLWKNSETAMRANRKFCENNADRFKTYRDGYWGISASDGPDGYKGYGAVHGMHDGTIPPYSLCMAVPFAPDIAIPAIRKLLREHGVMIWGKYGFVSSFNLERGWFSNEHVGIDEGIILLMLENYRSGFVWKYFMRNPYIRSGMKKAGFQNGPKQLDFEYLQALQDKRDNLDSSKTMACARMTPAIDGDLSEWNGRMHTFDPRKDLEFGEISADGDFAGSFGVGWNDGYIFIAADVTDRAVSANEKPSEIYKGDCVELYLDTKTKGNNFVWGDKEYYQIGFAPGSSEGRPVSWSWFQGGEQRESISMVTQRTEKGYRIEASISNGFLKLEAKPGVEVGMSLSIHDSNNTVEKGARKLTWNFRKVGTRILLGKVNLVE